MDIAGLGHVMCHHAKTVLSVIAGPIYDSSHQKEANVLPNLPPRKEDREDRTRGNEDIRMDGFHYLLSLWSTQIVLSY
ncbi:hypothetical protein COCHEDRAFT_1119092 [Bipolaris maydis C5]|uniref:Uncharacterized protein n=1 Tax=Cochliobolus heterostrophus (strain C5 / ATCC 48332 / race O) TaxID=701091 RepID=M2UC22_COCH5|nr:hypothetical protein COCHEDRAFT_1119092 [Bipolaris maydis C5]